VEKSKINTFAKFCKELGEHPPSQGAHATNLSTLTNFAYWLQVNHGVHCDFKGARAYIAPILRYFQVRNNPFDDMPMAGKRTLTLAYNKHAIIVSKAELALEKKEASHILKNFNLKGPKFFDQEERSSSMKHRHSTHFHMMATAFMLYCVTGLRPGSILRGTSDNKDGLALKLANVLVPAKGSKHEGECIFVLSDRSKTSKHKPVLTPVPFNKDSAKTSKECAATRLINLVKRRKKEGAKGEDFVFMNVRAQNRFPLSTGVMINAIRLEMISYFNKNMPLARAQARAKLYVLKSTRKGMASDMVAKGCAPQTISTKPGHGTIDAQMSYVCKLFKKDPIFAKESYAGLFGANKSSSSYSVQKSTRRKHPPKRWKDSTHAAIDLTTRPPNVCRVEQDRINVAITLSELDMSTEAQNVANKRQKIEREPRVVIDLSKPVIVTHRKAPTRRAPTRQCARSLTKQSFPGASATNHSRIGAHYQAIIPKLHAPLKEEDVADLSMLARVGAASQVWDRQLGEWDCKQGRYIDD